MNITRRQFFIGGAAATGAFGAFGGCRFFGAANFRAGGVPKLRFGVVSDIHITRVGADEKMEGWGNNLTFRHTLEWFRSQNVDAVMIAGDMADHGTDENLMAVAQAWYAVFPDDKYPDGRPIEKVFVYGNHDWEGFSYGNAVKKIYPDEKELARHIIRTDYSGWWEKAFHESYAPIYSKEIKGYTFIGTHWDPRGPASSPKRKTYAFGRIEKFMEANGKKLDPSLPFFYVQHPHPKDTCYGSWAWGRDRGVVTKTLSAYPNAIAFSGHSHYTLTDERSIWQGAFTSVGTSSLRYSGMPYDEHPPVGFENTASEGRDAWRHNAAKMMRNFAAGDCRQGMLWSVYDDCIVVKRREFLSNLDLGDDWVLPLPAAESKPFAFAEHAKKFRAPAFAPDAKLQVSTIKAKNRGGKSKDGKEDIPAIEKKALKVVAPPVVADKAARVFNLEFVAESKDGTKRTKLVIPEGFNHALTHAKAAASSFCVFACDEIAGDVRFAVTPINCFGARGKPLVSEWIKV